MFRFAVYTAVAIGVVLAIASNGLSAVAASAPSKSGPNIQSLGAEK